MQYNLLTGPMQRAEKVYSLFWKDVRNSLNKQDANQDAASDESDTIVSVSEK